MFVLCRGWQMFVEQQCSALLSHSLFRQFLHLMALLWGSEFNNRTFLSPTTCLHNSSWRLSKLFSSMDLENTEDVCSGVFSFMSVIHHQLKSLVKSWVEMSWKCFFRTLRGHMQRLSTNQELSWDIIDQWEADSWRSSVSDTLIVETCPDRIIEGEIILIICDLG